MAHSFDEALAIAADLPGDVMVAGGAQIYALALPYATHQVLTEIHASPDGDTRYPDWDRSGWVETKRVAGEGLDWVWWERRRGAMRLHIDAGLREPPYDQLKSRITEQVDSGALAPGDKLPTVRALATELGLAPNTVARAYRELEGLGVLSTRGRSGTFVAGDTVDRAAREAAAEYAERIRALGVGSADALVLVERALRQNGSA